MRALLQRVTRASVSVDGNVVAAIDGGLLVLLGIGQHDDERLAARLAEKVRKLRIFADAAGKMNLSLEQTGGACLVVSQFTLYGAAKGGNRPGFSAAAEPRTAERLYLHFAAELEAAGIVTKTGMFAADMAVELVNDGPITIWLDSAELF